MRQSRPIFIGPILLSVATLLSCSQEPLRDQDTVRVEAPSRHLTFTATIEGDPLTKTSVSGSSIQWNPHEQINIFYGSSAGSCFVSTNESPSTSVSFEGELDAFTGTIEGGEALSFWGIYPYSPENTSTGTSVSAELPSIQIGLRDNIPDKTLLMVAKSPGLSLPFRQVCSRLLVSLNRSDITEVVLRGNGGETLAGRVDVTMDASGNPVWTPSVSGGSQEVVLRSEGGPFAAGDYYMALLPQTLSGGFTVTYLTSTQRGVFSTSGAKVFERNKQKSVGSVQVQEWTDRPLPNSIVISPSEWMGEVGESVVLKVYVSGPEDYAFDPGMIYNSIDLTRIEKQEDGWTKTGDTWSNTYRLKAVAENAQTILFWYGDPATVDFMDLEHTTSAYAQIPVDILGHGEEIEFADPVTEAICLANYDRNGDGVLTVNEAAAVTTLLVNGVSPFCRPDDSSPRITTFDELRFFTGLTEIGEKAFYRQFSLSSVLLPDQITAIGTQAFAYSGITSIEIPESVETIGSSAFSLCNHLGQITIPASVRVIEGRAFFSCPLASVTFAEDGNLTTIGDRAFAYAYGASSVVIPDSVTSFGTGVFMYASVGHVRLPSSLTIIPQDTFYGAKVNEIEHDRWNQVTEIGDNAFCCDPAKRRTLPRALPAGLKIIGNNALQYVVLPADFTIPAGVTRIGDNAFRNTDLTLIELPSTLSTIGYGAFSKCPLEKVIVRCTTPATISQLGTGVLSETFGTLPALNGVILVPFDKEATYKSNWATWADYIQNNYASIPGGGNIGDDGDFGDGGDA